MLTPPPRPAAMTDPSWEASPPPRASADDRQPLPEDAFTRPPADGAAEPQGIGARVLDAVAAFTRRFVAYPSDHAADAHVLWIAHTWAMDSWENTPRIAFLSPEPGSGKSRALEVTELLVPRPVHSVNVTPAYLFRKVSDEEGAPTVLFDEVDTIFGSGPRGRENEDIRGLLNAGHRRGASAGRCVIKGKTVETEELPAYCAVALAGLHDLPDTIRTRSIVVRMRRRAPDETVEPFRHRVARPQAEPIRRSLQRWMEGQASALEHAYPDLPEQVQDRNADVFEPLVAIADAAGGDWPNRARVAAVALVADAAANARASLGIRLLADLRAIFDDHKAPHLPTETILAALTGMDEAPWGDLRGKPLDARGLSRRLSEYGIKPKTIRVGPDNTPKGYEAADLFDAWQRYLSTTEPPSADAPATSATSATSVPDALLCSECGGVLDDVLGTGVHVVCQ